METAALEIELLELLENEGLEQLKYSCHSLLEFWKHVPVIKYPKITLCDQKFISIFGTTYSCESLYLTMKMIKSKHRSTLTDDHLTESLIKIKIKIKTIIFNVRCNIYYTWIIFKNIYIDKSIIIANFSNRLSPLST